MEPIVRPVKLLTKLSHASCILVYFRSFTEARNVFYYLWQETRDFWEKHSKILATLFDNYRMHLRYGLDFDDEIAEYLLDQDRYWNYILDVYTFMKRGFTSLLNFIKSAKYPQMLKFAKIEVLFSVYSNDLAPNILYQLLKKLNIDSKWIDYDWSIHESSEIQKIEYWKNVYLNKIKWKHWKRIGKTMFENISSLKVLETINVPVEALEFINPNCIRALEEFKLEAFSSTLQDSVKVIKYTLHGNQYKHGYLIPSSSLFVDGTTDSSKYRLSFR